MPRFVVLEHDKPVLHWDFMVEDRGSLRTWRLQSAPRLGETTAAVPLAAHRIEYLDYEGPISGDRGRVLRWDRGEFEWVIDEDRAIGIVLLGTRLKGHVYLWRDASGDFWFKLTSECESADSLARLVGEPSDERPAR